MNYCSECGRRVKRFTLDGEEFGSWYCPQCRDARHAHPQIVCTAFIACDNKLLWVKRALEPQRGRWAIPGGFMELGETLPQAAARELREEAGVIVPADQMQLYMTGTISFISQLYVAFRASVDSTSVAPGPESMDCAFFAREECPWDEVAYPEVNDSILQAYDDLDSGQYQVWHAQMSETVYQLLPVSAAPLQK